MMLWMMGGNPAVIVSFDVIVGADMMHPFEEMIPRLLEDLSSIETNRLGY